MNNTKQVSIFVIITMIVVLGLFFFAMHTIDLLKETGIIRAGDSSIN